MIRLNDIHVSDLARYLSYLEPEPPITKAYDKWGVKYYPSQKIHMYVWIRNQPNTGKGAYSRKEGNTSSAVMYNRFLNPGGLLWLAEVLGETEETLKAAVQAAKEAEKIDYRKRCIAFRQVIPWERIMELFGRPQGWKIDPKMKAVLEMDPAGYPVVKPGKSRQFVKVLTAEEEMDSPPKQMAITEAQMKALGISEATPPKKEKLSKAERKTRGWEF